MKSSRSVVQEDYKGKKLIFQPDEVFVQDSVGSLNGGQFCGIFRINGDLQFVVDRERTEIGVLRVKLFPSRKEAEEAAEQAAKHQIDGEVKSV